MLHEETACNGRKYDDDTRIASIPPLSKPLNISSAPSSVVSNHFLRSAVGRTPGRTPISVYLSRNRFRCRLDSASRFAIFVQLERVFPSPFGGRIAAQTSRNM
jgi:hypothetical protein